jgi:hypothetical protein
MAKAIRVQGIIPTSGTERVSFFVPLDVVPDEIIAPDAFAKALERWAEGRGATYELSHNGAWVACPLKYVEDGIEKIER